ncbi:MAG: excinuclease ABC subunit A, partial [Rhodospirillaceae bacterium]|nr:excinuclease ABC subunit A [Rhodospirillaceae bacterium]
TISQMVDRVMKVKEGSRLLLLAPIVRGRKGEYKKELKDLAKRGFQRVKIDGEMWDIEDVPTLNKKVKHDIEVVVDRIKLKKGIESRLADSFETALTLADGIAFVDNADNDARSVFSAKFACPVSGFTIDEIEPRLFSFNNPFGACPTCDGLGTKMYIDPELVVPDAGKSLIDGAIGPWSNSSSPYYAQTLESLAGHFKFDINKPFGKLPAKMRDVVLFGTKGESVTMRYVDNKKTYEVIKPFEGVIPNMERRWLETDSNWVRDEISKYQTVTRCDACGGHRLRPEALAVKINKLHVSEVSGMSIAELVKWFGGLEKKLKKKELEIAERILREINER